jgi:hypothetical protein
MELAPLQDAVGSEFTAAKLVYKLIGYYGRYPQPEGQLFTIGTEF